MEIKIQSLKILFKDVDIIFRDGVCNEFTNGNLKDWVINLYDVKNRGVCDAGDILTIEFEDFEGNTFRGKVLAELIDEASECCILIGAGELNRI